MRKVTIIEHISLDGVIQAPGGPDEDHDRGFEHGGWIASFADPVIRDHIVAAHDQPFDLLLGRRTYDIWAAYWPTAPSGPFADRFNAATKYVATHRPESLTWGPAQSLGEDIVAGVHHLRASPAMPASAPTTTSALATEVASGSVFDSRNLIVWGSSTLTPLLLAHGLVDELLLLVYPVLLGAGKRIYSPADSRAPRQALTLIRTTPTPSGVLLNSYRPTVPPSPTGARPGRGPSA